MHFKIVFNCLVSRPYRLEFIGHDLLYYFDGCQLTNQASIWSVNNDSNSTEEDQKDPTSCKLFQKKSSRSEASVVAEIPMASDTLNYCLPFNEAKGEVLLKCVDFVPKDNCEEEEEEEEERAFRIRLMLWDLNE